MSPKSKKKKHSHNSAAGSGGASTTASAAMDSGPDTYDLKEFTSGSAGTQPQKQPQPKAKQSQQPPSSQPQQQLSPQQIQQLQRQYEHEHQRYHEQHAGHEHDGHSHGGHNGHSHSHSHSPPRGKQAQSQSQSQSRDSKKREPEKKSEAVEEAEHFVDVIRHFNHYAVHTFQRVNKFDSDFRRISSDMRAVVPGWDDKIKAIRRGVMENQKFIRSLTDNRHAFMHSPDIDYDALEAESERPEYPINEERMSKVRSTLRQCMRDWSKEGFAERSACYGAILRELEVLYPNVATRGSVNVLVPGCGLARLVWDICRLGFSSQGNEFSYFMLVCSYYILNCMTAPDAVTLYPFIHDTKNVLNAKDQLRGVSIPDVNPTELPKSANFSMVAGDFLEVYGEPSQRGTWDSIATCFFIDTANNIVEYVRLLNWLLKPGGTWVNFGPLLYHYAEMDNELSVELAWDEVKATFAPCGFKLIKEQTGLPCPYASNIRGLLQQTYLCVLSVCVKTGDGMGWPGSQVRSKGSAPLGPALSYAASAASAAAAVAAASAPSASASTASAAAAAPSTSAAAATASASATATVPATTPAASAPVSSSSSSSAPAAGVNKK